MPQICMIAIALLSAPEAGKEEAPLQPTNYELRVAASPTHLEAGQPASYTLTIVPKGEYVLKEETPLSLKLVGSEGVTLAQNTFNNGAIAGQPTPEKTVSAEFKATPGTHTIDGELSFFLCTPKLCERFTATPKLAFKVEK